MLRILISLAFGLFFSSTGKAQFKKHNNIKFDFKVGPSPLDSDDFIKIYGTLYNPNKDTVYLLATTCNGLEYALQYDNVKIKNAGVSCAWSWPMTEKIPPKGKLEFTARFELLSKVKEIKLCFDLYELDRFYETEDVMLDAYISKKRNKNIIGVVVKTIK